MLSPDQVGRSRSGSVNSRENRIRPCKIYEVIHRGRLEAQVLVEGGRLRIEGVGSHGAYSGDLGGFEGPEKRIPYQCPAEPSSLVGTGHGKTGKDHDRDRSHFRRAIMSSDGEAGAVETKTAGVAGYVCLKNGDGAVKPVFFSYPAIPGLHIQPLQSSQEMGPPTNPGRFNLLLVHRMGTDLTLTLV